MAEKHYIQERQKQELRSWVIGGALTAVAHGALVVGFAFSGFTYLDPPPPDKEQILIEFEQPKVEKPKQRRDGTRPRAEVPTKETNLVQQSEAQHIGTKTNEAQEATVGDKGDVEVPEPPRKEINKRAL